MTPAEGKTQNLYPNKFPYTCSTPGCGIFVPVGDGWVRRIKNDDGSISWEKLCDRCATADPNEVAAQRQQDIETNAAAWEEAALAPIKVEHPLTEEQDHIVDLFSQGLTIAVEAGAGAGKTSTLVACATTTARQGTFLAFNSNIVRDVLRKLPRNVQAFTTHALARRAVGRPFEHRLNPKGQSRVRRDLIARQLGIKPFNIMVEKAGESALKVIQPKVSYGYVLDAITKFCESADKEPSIKHFRYIDGIDFPDPETGARTFYNNDKVHEELAPWLKVVWADLSDPKGTLPYERHGDAGHAYYLKIWELSGPEVPGDFILIDESQDLAPVQISIVEQQPVQTIWVGDSMQQVYSWRGATNALKNVSVDDRAFLTNSFRFGSAIADVANDILATIPSSELVLKGLGGPSTLGPHDEPNCILTRTNAGAIGVVLGELEKGRKVFLIGGGGEVASFAKGALELQQSGSTQQRELMMFENWSDVQEYAEHDDEGEDLKLLVKLIDDYGAEDVIKAVGNTVTEARADVVVSTGHRSKGREWDVVRLHADFPIGSEEKPVPEEDRRLLYVAATRARKHLDYSTCPALLKIRGEDGGEES